MIPSRYCRRVNGPDEQLGEHPPPAVGPQHAAADGAGHHHLERHDPGGEEREVARPRPAEAVIDWNP